MIELLRSSMGSTPVGLFICVLTAFLLPACQPTPVSPPTIPESQRAVQKSEPTEAETPVEASKRPGTDTELTLKLPKEMIARLLPESLVGAPEKDSASRRIDYNTTISSRSSEMLHKAAWQYRVTRQGQLVGFEFSNQGGNPILPMMRDASKNQFFTRDFQFRFDERARQDIHLMVSDWVPSRDRIFRLSELMHSLMLFFPRKFLPAIVNLGSRDIVTLPTGEEVEFDADTHEIRGGVLSEMPVDLSPERSARKFPGIDYRGNGVVVSVSSRGADPRIGAKATITAGAQRQYCDGGIRCNQCQVPSKDLWDQTGALRFRFATDVEFDRFLLERCGFALPRVGAEFAVASPVQ